MIFNIVYLANLLAGKRNPLRIIQIVIFFDPFVPNAPLLMFSGVFKFSDVFGGYRKSALGTNGLKQKQLNSTETR